MGLLKKFLLTLVPVFAGLLAFAQCSICSKTASQMGEEAGRGLNAGILYLAAAPLIILGFIGYRWWKSNAGN